VGRTPPTDGFPKTLGINIAQNAFKSTGSYLGAMIRHEDPRQVPPFLIMRGATAPHGFAKRVWHALVVNAVAYKCQAACAEDADIKPMFALSRVLGSMASGFAPELWSADRSVQRAIRGSATAYGATFANSLFVEFKPELGAFAGRLFSIF